MAVKKHPQNEGCRIILNQLSTLPWVFGLTTSTR